MMYSLAGIIALIVILFLNYEPLFSKRYPATNPNALGAYRIFLISSIFYLITDILWGLLFELENKTPVFIDTAVYFIAMSIFVFTWTRFVVKYLGSNRFFNRIILAVGLIVALAGITLVIINFFTPVLFTYESSYNTGLGRYIYIGVQFLIFVFTFIYTIIYFSRSHNKNKLQQYAAISAVSLVFVITTIVQFFQPLYPVYSVGIGLGITLLHVFVVLREKTNFRQKIAEGRDREKQQISEIESTKELAYTDPLTGVKNKHAYVELEEQMNINIREGKMNEFSLFIFDLNDLKNINDTYGHEMGDRYIIKSVDYIKQFFPGLEIYRFGGDEFIIILQGENYKNRFQMMERFNKRIEENISTDEPIVSVGFSDYIKEKDNTLQVIFIRADERMYARKRKLKELTGEIKPESVVKSKLINKNLRLEIYEMFHRNENFSLIDFLNGLSADEVVEIDVENDTFKQYYHVEGKYFVPNVGLSYRELLDFTSRYIVHPDDRGDYLRLMKIDGFFERLANAHIPNFDFAHFRYKLQDGQYRYVEQVVITGEENGIPKGMFRMYVYDIQNLKSRQSGISSDASGLINVGRDTVTGLLTGKDFLQTAEAVIKEEPDKKWCLIAIDIEHFKFFDEWFGREKGDYLLAKIGAELKDSEEKCGGVAGYSGQDDFIVLFPYDMKLINDLYEKLKAQINTFGLSAGFLPAFGVATIEKDMMLVDAFDRATIAATTAKGDMKNRISVFNTEMQFRSQQEYIILTDFIHALQDKQIVFYLQPQCRLANGSIVGAEALVRWIKKDGTMVSPATFIPILEKYGFISDLDVYIWEEVAKWIKNWTDKGHACVPISVNVSRVDIFNLDIAKIFHDLCEKYQIPHKLLKIEITESAYAEIASIIDNLVTRLKKDGFSVLMDDFGSGYSSLNMLSTVKLDAIKLDANFLNIKDNSGIHVIESVVHMTKTMSLPVIVEGVETKLQTEFLYELGCQYAQGYYFYRPIPIKEFEKLISDPKKFDTKGFTFKSNEQFRVREFLDRNVYSDSMLNNIIGAVAIYSWHDEHVDIVRFNQQFYESVNIPEFSERLLNIEQFVPESDRPMLFEALKEAMDNRLTGSNKIIRFYRTDGLILSFRIHFYYLGKKEGGERFYGSAANVTELVELRDSKKLVAKYSRENMILIRKNQNKFVYMVASHGLSDVLGLTPAELEEELNNGKFAKRILDQNRFKQFMKEANEHYDKDQNFKGSFDIYDLNHKIVKLSLDFYCVKAETSNIDYILRTNIIEN